MKKAARKVEIKAKRAVRRGRVVRLVEGDNVGKFLPGDPERPLNPCAAFGKLVKLRKDTAENRTLLRTQEAVAKAIQEGVAGIDECRFEVPGFVASFEVDHAVRVPTIRLKVNIGGNVVDESTGKSMIELFAKLDEEEVRALSAFLRYHLAER